VRRQRRPSHLAGSSGGAGYALHQHTFRLIRVGRIEEASAATRKAIEAYRERAGTAGADVAFVGQQLLGLSANLCYGGLHADSAAAAGAAG
jgi:hypothetical protein